MRAVGITLLVALWACDSGRTSAPREVPGSIAFQSQPSSASPVVGSTYGPLGVVVKDSAGNPLPNVLVNFAVTQGGGRLSRVADTTGTDGTVSITLTLATAVGTARVSATTAGLAPVQSSPVTTVAGPTTSVVVPTRSIRIAANVDSVQFPVQYRDAFGNASTSPVIWVSDNLGAVFVSASPSPSTVIARVITRPAKVRLYASKSGIPLDSVLVTVHDSNSKPCDSLATPAALALGEIRSFDGPMTACFSSGGARTEYAVIMHYGTSVTSVATSVTLSATGIVPPTPGFPGTVAESAPVATPDDAQIDFERGVRARERDAMQAHAAGARAWAQSRPPALSAQTREGDVAEFNTNAFDYCANPSHVPARVVAITDATVILADVDNPAGGLTDDEYRELGRLIDTLVVPVDTTAFGASADIDGNGRIAILFTKAVNALTARGSTSAALGFFYSRDLLPQQSPFGSCPGSNVGEMFYVLVPDPQGIVADPRSKTFVRNVLVATIAHEYQHLINASRRLYLSKTAPVNEEIWLNEALSHVAEELVFYRVTGTTPRQNIGPEPLSGTGTLRSQYDLYQSANFSRYQQYLRAPDLNTPIAENDLLATRGAAWAFLRYLADRVATGSTDGDLWRKIVAGPGVGMANIDKALAATGVTVSSALRDWGTAVLLDDIVPSVPAAFQQPSWNYVGAFPQVGLNLWLVPSVLVNGFGIQVQMRGGSNAYARFAVAANEQALLLGSGPGGVTPAGVRFSVVRIK